MRDVNPLARPIFVVAPPQSGTALVAEALGRLPGMRTLDPAGRAELDGAAELRPALRGHDSNRRTAEDASPETAERLRAAITEAIGPAPERLIDSTPRNALRVPYLDAVFPDASFVYVYREPRDTLSSMAEAWESGDYATYPGLPDWPGPPWSLLLIPGWRELAGAPIAEIVATQWVTATRILLADLEQLAPERWCVADFARLASEPFAELERVAAFLGLEWNPDAIGDDPVPGPEEPGADADVARSEALQRVLPRTIGLAERARDLISQPLSPRPTATPDSSSPLRSSYTGAMARLLGDAGVSLLLSLGDADLLVYVRRDDPRLNTHFRKLDRPGAIAVAGERIAVVGRGEIWVYERSAEGLAALPAEPAHDACFVPRSRTLVGDLGDPSLEYAGETLWVAAPSPPLLAISRPGEPLEVRWRPAGTDAERRLAGFAVVAGKPAFATLHGDGPAGGTLTEIATGRAVSADLCLPCSPVWHESAIWLLEAGEGALVRIDPADGSKRVVAHMPGLARGLAITAGVAFVGVSQLHDDELELPVAERFEERFCGVWALDLETGSVRGHLRFEDRPVEVRDIAALPGVRFAEIAAPGSAAALAAHDLTNHPDPVL